MKASDRYAMYAGDVPMAAVVTGLVDGWNLAKAAARARPGVEHTVTIDGEPFARARMGDRGMEVWVR